MSDSDALQTTGDGAPQNSPVRQADFTPRSMQELEQFAKTVSQSRMVPKKYRGNPQDITVAVMHGMELGLPPLQALQSVAVINGRPSIYGDAALALVRKSGLCEYVKEWQAQEDGEPVAYCKALRKGDPEPTQQRFSWSEAQEAGLTGGKGPWNDYPRRMLQMRARSWCLRDAFPDVLSGLMLAEEAEAIPESNGPSLDPQGEIDRKEPWWYRKIRSRITEKVRNGKVSAGEIDWQTVPESHPISEWPDSEVEKLDSALTNAERQSEESEDASDTSGKATGSGPSPGKTDQDSQKSESTTSSSEKSTETSSRSNGTPQTSQANDPAEQNFAAVQEAQAGTPLPEGLIGRNWLMQAGIETVEHLRKIVEDDDKSLTDYDGIGSVTAKSARQWVENNA